MVVGGTNVDNIVSVGQPFEEAFEVNVVVAGGNKLVVGIAHGEVARRYVACPREEHQGCKHKAAAWVVHRPKVAKAGTTSSQADVAQRNILE